MLTSIDSWKNKKKFIVGLACVFITCLSLLGMYKNYMEKQNEEIEKTIVRYYMAMSNKDMEELKNNIYPENVDYVNGFILDIKAKMDATNFESIKIDSIYPALIDGDMAIVGYRAITKSYLNGRNENAITFQELGTTVMLRKGNKWYVAKPIDVQGVSTDYLNDFFDKYEDILRKNVSEEEAENVVESQKHLFSILTLPTDKSGGFSGR